MSSATASPQSPPAARIATAIGGVLLAAALSALFFYKWGGSLRALRRVTDTGARGARVGVRRGAHDRPRRPRGHARRAPHVLRDSARLPLLHLGAPPGAAVALLVAGPIVNLPSLLVLARETRPRVAAELAVGVWAVASLAGLLATIG